MLQFLRAVSDLGPIQRPRQERGGRGEREEREERGRLEITSGCPGVHLSMVE